MLVDINIITSNIYQFQINLNLNNNYNEKQVKNNNLYIFIEFSNDDIKMDKFRG
jgi:hypothetical protein